VSPIGFRLFRLPVPHAVHLTAFPHAEQARGILPRTLKMAHVSLFKPSIAAERGDSVKWAWVWIDKRRRMDEQATQSKLVWKK
jgi:hypothetical protein